jgi:hypothetical protein
MKIEFLEVDERKQGEKMVEELSIIIEGIKLQIPEALGATGRINFFTSHT